MSPLNPNRIHILFLKDVKRILWIYINSRVKMCTCHVCLTVWQLRSLKWNDSSLTWVIVGHQLLLSLLEEERRKEDTLRVKPPSVLLSLFTWCKKCSGQSLLSLLILLHQMKKYFAKIIFQYRSKFKRFSYFKDTGSSHHNQFYNDYFQKRLRKYNRTFNFTEASVRFLHLRSWIQKGFLSW